MKLTVFGATGATGEQIVRHGLAAGHEVTAVVRNPDAMRVADPRLRVRVGDVLQPESVPPAVAGAGAVLSALGSRTMRQPTSVYSAGTAAVLAAMRDAGVRRFVGITAAPVGPRAQQSPLDRYLLHPLLWWAFGAGYADMRRMETLVAASGRDWTVFRPPRLTDTAATGHYRLAVDTPLPRAWTISRADLAAAMVAAVTDSTMVGHAVSIAA
ncbi:MAG TPA: NAD(P)H-binding protein [Pseudonocardiaceae bacterium]|nr:NAD(P)H-binding protein [Pseudonocardiaceae bacterium]